MSDTDNPSRLIAIDVESTGTRPTVDRIIEMAVVGWRGVPMNWKVDPEHPISISASVIHGCTDANMVGRTTFKSFAHEIVGSLRMWNPIIVGYNILHFDIPMIERELRRAGVSFTFPTDRVVDLYQLYGPRSLRYVVKNILNEESEKTHHASTDAAWCLRLLQHYVLSDIGPEFRANRPSIVDELTKIFG